MKAKNRVAAILAVCIIFFFAMVFDIAKNNQAQDASAEVAKSSDGVTQALTGEMVDNHTAIDSEKQLLIEEKEATKLTTNSSLSEQEPTEEIAPKEIDPLEVIESTAINSIEDTFIMTLSLSEMEFDFDKVIPKVNESLNIRKEANSESEVVGKLYKNSCATILERQEEWTKISSGNVIGYASNQYLYFDDDAIAIAKSLDAFVAEVTAGTVNIRTKPTTESGILKEAKKGDTFTHVPEMDSEEWVAIQYTDGKIAYLSSKYVTTYLNLKSAVSKEEEEAARKAAELAKALEEAKKYKPEKTNRPAITVSDEDIFLLATVVAMEAIGESYEGQLAVANVVINRMLDGYWGDTIPEVVYAKGQFSGANSGRIERFEPKVTESCKRAAVEALAGNNNIGDYMFFIMNNKANYSSYKKYYILGCHCFYSRT